MRRVWLLVGLVVLMGSGAAEAALVGLRQATTGLTVVSAPTPGTTVELELYLDTEGLSFEGYYLGIDFIGGAGLLTLQTVEHQALTGLFADIFGTPVIDDAADTIRHLNQSTFSTPLGAGEYVLDLITVEVGALAPGQEIMGTPGLFGEVLGLDGGACPTMGEGCTVSFSSVLIVPEPGSALLMTVGLLGLGLQIRKEKRP